MRNTAKNMRVDDCSSRRSCIFESCTKSNFYVKRFSDTETNLQAGRTGESPAVISMLDIDLVHSDPALFVSSNSNIMCAKKNHVKNVSIKDLISGPDPKQSYSENIVSEPKIRSKSVSDKDDFFARYKDPRWQKKRLQIMERDGFECVSCQSKDRTLNVHYKTIYRNNTMPWEYDDDELITLCEDCHNKVTEMRRECNIVVARKCDIVCYGQNFRDVVLELDEMNPYQLSVVKNIIQLIREY